MDLKVTKDMRIGEMLSMDGGIAYILMMSGMHCIGCPSSIGESLEEACEVHGLDSINVYLDARQYEGQ